MLVAYKHDNDRNKIARPNFKHNRFRLGKGNLTVMVKLGKKEARFIIRSCYKVKGGDIEIITIKIHVYSEINMFVCVGVLGSGWG